MKHWTLGFSSYMLRIAQEAHDFHLLMQPLLQMDIFILPLNKCLRERNNDEVLHY